MSVFIPLFILSVQHFGLESALEIIKHKKFELYVCVCVCVCVQVFFLVGFLQECRSAGVLRGESHKLMD